MNISNWNAIKLFVKIDNAIATGSLKPDFIVSNSVWLPIFLKKLPSCIDSTKPNSPYSYVQAHMFISRGKVEADPAKYFTYHSACFSYTLELFRLNTLDFEVNKIFVLNGALNDFIEIDL